MPIRRTDSTATTIRLGSYESVHSTATEPVAEEECGEIPVPVPAQPIPPAEPAAEEGGGIPAPPQPVPPAEPGAEKGQSVVRAEPAAEEGGEVLVPPQPVPEGGLEPTPAPEISPQAVLVPHAVAPDPEAPTPVPNDKGKPIPSPDNQMGLEETPCMWPGQSPTGNEVDPRAWDVPLSNYLFEDAEDSYKNDTDKLINDCQLWLRRRMEQKDIEQVDPSLADPVNQIDQLSCEALEHDDVAIRETWGLERLKVKEAAQAMTEVQKKQLKNGSISQEACDAKLQKLDAWMANKLKHLDDHHSAALAAYQAKSDDIEAKVVQLIELARQAFEAKLMEPFVETVDTVDVDSALMHEMQALLDNTEAAPHPCTLADPANKDIPHHEEVKAYNGIEDRLGMHMWVGT